MTKPILVHISDRRWTMQALHLACALARNQTRRVVLLRLIPVQYLAELGTPLGNIPPTKQEAADLLEYTATAEDYGVDLSLTLMQCLYPLEALHSAAAQLDAEAVFIHNPPSRIPFWQALRAWRLKRHFAALSCQLFTLDEAFPFPEQVPSISLSHSHASVNLG